MADATLVALIAVTPLGEEPVLEPRVRASKPCENKHQATTTQDQSQ